MVVELTDNEIFSLYTISKMILDINGKFVQIVLADEPHIDLIELNSKLKIILDDLDEVLIGKSVIADYVHNILEEIQNQK